MKSQFRDIIPSEKRSIRNVTLSEPKTKHSDREDDVEARDIRPKSKRASKQTEPEENIEIVFGDRSIFSRLILWGISFASVMAVFFVVTHFLYSADITAETKKWQVDMPTKLDLSLQPKANQVGYSIVTLTDSISDTLDANGEKNVETKSSGTLIVYNAVEATSQTLVAGTRFQSPKGLIYKLDKPVTIPGAKATNGKSIPGSLEVSVTAEKPGSEYNIGLDDFTLPGLKGTARFTKVYARSKASMAGGSVGKIATVDDSLLNKKVEEMKTQLTQKMKEKAKKELPSGNVAFDSLSSITFTTSNPEPQGKKAQVKVEGSYKVYLLDGHTLAAVLLGDKGVKITNQDNFDFDTSATTAEFSDETKSIPEIQFGGQISINTKLDTQKLKESLLGASIDSVPEVSKKFAAIAKISTAVKPFWKTTLPTDLKKISVIAK